MTGALFRDTVRFTGELDARTLTVKKIFNGNKYITTKYKYKYLGCKYKYKYKYFTYKYKYKYIKTYLSTSTKYPISVKSNYKPLVTVVQVSTIISHYAVEQQSKTNSTSCSAVKSVPGGQQLVHEQSSVSLFKTVFVYVRYMFLYV